MKKILIISIYRPSWQFYIKLDQFVKSGYIDSKNKIDFIDCINFDFDELLVSSYHVVFFFHHDPLKQLYPEAYQLALRLEDFCKSRGIEFPISTKAISATGKVEQISSLRGGGFSAASAWSLKSLDDVFEKNVEFPFFLRYEFGHDSESLNYTSPFLNLEEYREKMMNGFFDQMWPNTEHLKGIAAVKWVDSKSSDGYYRKYRIFVVGDSVFHGNLSVSSNWYVHTKDRISGNLFDDECDRFLHSPATDIEINFFKRVAEYLNLPICAIDYSILRDGRFNVWEVNPHPAWSDKWSNDSYFTNVFIKSFENYFNKF